MSLYLVLMLLGELENNRLKEKIVQNFTGIDVTGHKGFRNPDLSLPNTIYLGEENILLFLTIMKKNAIMLYNY